MEPISFLPQSPPDDEIPLTREAIIAELQAPSAQNWIRALANFQVLGSRVILGGLTSQEQRPLWEARIKDLANVPKLFRAIQKTKTAKGVDWERALSVRQVLTKDGQVTVATGYVGTPTIIES